jgi:hypothetical protein
VEDTPLRWITDAFLIGERHVGAPFEWRWRRAVCLSEGEVRRYES